MRRGSGEIQTPFFKTLYKLKKTLLPCIKPEKEAKGETLFSQ